MSYQRWHTLLELNQDVEHLGLKGWTFFIVDFPMDIETRELKYLIAQPTFTGLGVSTGISSFVISEEKIGELFSKKDMTFNEYAKELTAAYFEKE